MVAVPSPAPVPSAPARRARHPAIEFCRQQPLGAVSALVILVMLFASIFAEKVVPYDPVAIDFLHMLNGPGGAHMFGTDAFGRDILSRLIYGARTALIIGLTSSFVGCTLGAVLGAAQDLRPRYPHGIVNHVHVEFRDRDGHPLDPTPLMRGRRL